jgi:hypothetical protein
MMNKIFFLICFSLVSFSLLGQFNYGFKAGLNHSNRANTFGWKTSVHAGIFTTYALNDKLTFGVDLLLSDKGFKRGRVNTHMIYLSLPLYTRYHLTKRLSIDGGSSIAMLTRSFEKYGNHITDLDYWWGNELEIGALIGLHYKINSRVGLSCRYEQAFPVMFFNKLGFSKQYPELNPKVRNGNFQFSLNIRLGGKDR